MEYPVPVFDYILGQPRVTQGPRAEATLRVIVFAVFALASMHYRIPYARLSLSLGLTSVVWESMLFITLPVL